MTAVLLAAGRGERIGGRTPKQYQIVAGVEMLEHSLSKCVMHPRIDHVVLVAPPDRVRPSPDKALSIVPGGDARQESLKAGLHAIPRETEIVLVHDAARPNLTHALIDAALDGISGEFEGAICAVPVDDSLKQSSGDEIVSVVDREGLFRAQTPQAFVRTSLEEALALAAKDGYTGSDCSELLTRAKKRVRLVQGGALNIKVTTPQDFHLANLLLMEQN